MPRPPVYPAHSRAILVTSAPPLHLLRNCHPSGLPALCVYASKALVRLICASLVNPFVSNSCALFFSLAALFHTRSLCFQWFADSFAKYSGGGGVSRQFWNIGAGSYDGFSQEKLDWRWFKTGEPTSPHCRRRRLCPALEARHPAAAPAQGSLQHPA